MKGTKINIVWARMRDRCNNPNAKSYKDYGGRGITVCERWAAFTAFYADMGDPPPGHEIERIDNNGNYEPSNCRWATQLEQANNKRNNRWLTVRGETKTAPQWGRISGIGGPRIRSRIDRGWDPERAIFTPVVRV